MTTLKNTEPEWHQELKANTHFELEMRVHAEDLASLKKTSQIAALSTPATTLFIEQTCIALLNDKLPIGTDSISIEMNIKHLVPIKEGAVITCKARLKYIDGYKLFFDVVITDSTQVSYVIGAHERYIVDIDQYTSTFL